MKLYKIFCSSMAFASCTATSLRDHKLSYNKLGVMSGTCVCLGGVLIFSPLYRENPQDR